MKLITIWQSTPTLQILLTKEMPVKTSYKITRIWREVKPILEDIETQRDLLLEKFKIDVKNPDSHDTKSVSLFNEEFNDFLEEDFKGTLECIKEYPLSLEELDGIDLMPNSLIALDFILKND